METVSRAIEQCPDDLLVTIFQEVLESSRDHEKAASTLLPLLTVSKRWKVRVRYSASFYPRSPANVTFQHVAEPVLYHTLDFAMLKSLTDGVRAIQAASAAGKNVEHWIRRITIIDEDDLDSTHAIQLRFGYETTRLLDLTSQVEVFDVETCNAAEVISRLALRAPESLRKLTLSCWPSQVPFSQLDIGAFAKLRELTIYMLEANWHQETQELFTPCSLPSLATLYWNGYPFTGFFHFLARSSFPSLTSVDVCNSSPLSPLTSELLRTFFRRHSFSEVGLVLALEDEFAQILPSVRAETVMMMAGSEYWIPPPQAVAHLQPAVKTLKMHGDPAGERLWSFLDEIRHMQPCRLEKVIILTMTPGSFFHWIPAEVDGRTNFEAAAFIGTLLRYAALLARRGIAIHDSSGLTVFSYFPSRAV